MAYKERTLVAWADSQGDHRLIERVDVENPDTTTIHQHRAGDETSWTEEEVTSIDADGLPRRCRGCGVTLAAGYSATDECPFCGADVVKNRLHEHLPCDESTDEDRPGDARE